MDVEAGKAVYKDTESNPSFHGGDGPIIVRTGTTFSAFMLVITAVIGAGVLSLPYSLAVLGYPGGIVCLLVFSWLTLYTSQLLADVNVVKGQRMRSYTQTVDAVLGRQGKIILAWLQQVNLVMTALAYSITASYALQTVATSVCDYQHVGAESCFDKYWKWACIFGAFQIIPCFIPNLDSTKWTAWLGAAMSFGYSSIALGRSIAEGNTHGSASGITDMTKSEKVFGIFNSLGAILFAYSFSMILPEIQDTIDEKRVKGGHIAAMKRTVNYAVTVMTLFYMAVAIAGYMAYGNDVAGNVLNSFVDPRWLVDMANIMVIVHMVPAYQVWSQPFFFYIEDNLPLWWPSRPALFRGWSFRLWFRPLYVVIVTVLSICMPFFSYIIGLVGAIGFWPTTVHFPVRMWIAVFNPSPRKKLWLEFLNVFCAIVTLFALIGAIQSIIVAWSSFTFFE